MAKNKSHSEYFSGLLNEMSMLLTHLDQTAEKIDLELKDDRTCMVANVKAIELSRVVSRARLGIKAITSRWETL